MLLLLGILRRRRRGFWVVVDFGNFLNNRFQFRQPGDDRFGVLIFLVLLVAEMGVAMLHVVEGSRAGLFAGLAQDMPMFFTRPSWMIWTLFFKDATVVAPD